MKRDVSLASLLTRRQWLGHAIGGISAAFFLGACTRTFREEEPVPLDFFIFSLAAHPTQENQSILYWADMRGKWLRTFDVPIHDAHSVFSWEGDRSSLYVIGKESPRLCRFNLAQQKVDRVVEVGAGFVTSGHATALVRGKRHFLVTSEYRLEKPSEGFLCFRDPASLAEVERHSSFGPYPHVVTTLPLENEIMVQNLGHRAGMEYYSPSALISAIDGNQLALKRQVRPGREGTPYQFLPSRSGDREDDRLFRQTASYILDSRRSLFPRRPLQSIAHTNLNSVSIWDAYAMKMLSEVPLPMSPLGTTHYKESGVVMAVGATGVIQLEPPDFEPRALRYLENLHSSQHLFVLPANSFAVSETL